MNVRAACCLYSQRELNQYPAITGFNLEVATVDSFQGREATLVIFSCVRAGNNGSIGFLADRR